MVAMNGCRICSVTKALKPHRSGFLLDVRALVLLVESAHGVAQLEFPEGGRQKKLDSCPDQFARMVMHSLRIAATIRSSFCVIT